MRYLDTSKSFELTQEFKETFYSLFNLKLGFKQHTLSTFLQSYKVSMYTSVSHKFKTVYYKKTQIIQTQTMASLPSFIFRICF